MKNKVFNVIILVVIVVCCFVSGLSIGVIIESLARIGKMADTTEEYIRSADFLVKVGEGTLTEEEKAKIFTPFWETFDMLHEYYIDQPLDETALMEGAIRGMIESLGDPHTRYADPASYEQEASSMIGNYQGIGAFVQTGGEYIEITKPISGSPAEKANLRTGDLVIALDGVDMTGIDPEVVLQKMRGPEGSTVTLTILRGGEEPFDVTITRQKIDVAQAEGKMLENNIAYIRLTQFGDVVFQELQSSLNELVKQDPAGLILDLRDNGGGYLDAAVDCAGVFLPESSLVLTDEENQKKTEYYTEDHLGIEEDVPMVVLINDYSASASEILAGALKYHERATLIGVKSYGKGSVQIQGVLSNGGAVSVTVGRWYTPDGTLIHGIGIEPDIAVEMTEEDFQNDRDPQLDAAVSFLLGDLAEKPISGDNKPEGL